MEYSTEKERRKRAPLDMSDWVVIDDWPKPVPVTIDEIYVFEAYFGDILDELLQHTLASRFVPYGKHLPFTAVRRCGGVARPNAD